MELIFYFSFVYMLIHLIIVGFKKGEKFRFHLDEVIVATYKDGSVEGLRLGIIKVVFRIKAIFDKKYKLALKEIQKPYNIPFEKEFIEKATNKEIFAKDLFDIVKTIYDFKERKEYLNFKFDDSLMISRRLQFLELKKSIAQQQSFNFINTIFELYRKGNMKQMEVDEWKQKFIKNGLLDINERPKEVSSLKEVFKKKEEEAAIADEVETVATRDVQKKRKVRFDKSMEK